MEMLQEAVSKNMSAETIKSFMDLRDRWEASEARKAFTVALTAFKSESIVILKSKKVSFTTRDGDTTSYRHAELSDITAAILEPMAKYQLAHRWEVRQEGGMVTVDCILMHALGHSEKVTLSAPPDDSGKKNKIQQIASTVSYLERYTLLAVTGLSTKGMDDDGRAAGEGQLARLSEEQCAAIRKKIEEMGADAAERAEILNQFLTYRKVDNLEDIAGQAYEDCIRALETRRKKSHGKA